MLWHSEVTLCSPTKRHVPDQFEESNWVNWLDFPCDKKIWRYQTVKESLQSSQKCKLLEVQVQSKTWSPTTQLFRRKAPFLVNVSALFRSNMSGHTFPQLYLISLPWKNLSPVASLPGSSYISPPELLPSLHHLHVCPERCLQNLGGHHNRPQGHRSSNRLNR